MDKNRWPKKIIQWLPPRREDEESQKIMELNIKKDNLEET